jgi:hypothetical protein
MQEVPRDVRGAAAKLLRQEPRLPEVLVAEGGPPLQRVRDGEVVERVKRRFGLRLVVFVRELPVALLLDVRTLRRSESPRCVHSPLGDEPGGFLLVCRADFP